MLRRVQQTCRWYTNRSCSFIETSGEDPGPSETLFRQFGGDVHLGGKKLTKSLLNIIGKVRMVEIVFSIRSSTSLTNY